MGCPWDDVVVPSVYIIQFSNSSAYISEWPCDHFQSQTKAKHRRHFWGSGRISQWKSGPRPTRVPKTHPGGAPLRGKCSQSIWGNIAITTSLLSLSLPTGNVLNIIVLIRRMKDGIETIERASLAGMMSLAISDFLFCLVTIFVTYLMEKKMVYDSWNISLFCTMYGHYFQNVFIKISTGITVVMSIFRHSAVIYPVRVCRNISLVYNIKKLGLLITFCLWLLLYLPSLWMWRASEITCDLKTFILLELGEFSENVVLNQSMMYFNAILGFFIPLMIMAYCNINIIMSLNRRRRTRHIHMQIHSSNQTSKFCTQRDTTSTISGRLIRNRNRKRTSQWQASVTLVAIVVCFFILVCPGELYNFWLEVFPEVLATWRHKDDALVICNVLQALDMSLRFILYCVVNTNFRKTAISLTHVLRTLHESDCMPVHTLSVVWQ